MTTKKLLRWQVYWAKFLSRFNFVIFYILSKENIKINSLTRQPNDCLIDDKDD